MSTRPASAERGAGEDERQRAGTEIASRLRQRGVQLSGTETDEELVSLLEAVERFETVVEKHGGDLMMDEPVRTGRPIEPDNAAFVLPARAANESIASFIGRIIDAAVRAGQVRRAR
jgi:hypothetical protein